MEQDKIDWTLEVISRLKQEGIGDEKKLNDLQYQLENNFAVSDKDSKYIKKHYEILEKREAKERAKVCSRCKKKLGFIKYSPSDYWGYDEKVCGDCFTLMKSNCTSFEGKFVNGTIDLKEGSKIEMHLNNFDGGSIAISSKKYLDKYTLNQLKSFQEVELERDSFTKKIITAGLKDKSKSDTIELQFETNDNSEERILLKFKEHEKATEEIYNLKKSPDKNEIEQSAESQDDEKTPVEEWEEKWGKFIKQTPSAQYYGGHKAYLAGGTFGDAQNGTLILSEKYLLFQKSAMRESKRWEIHIPLDKVILGDWKIDEKVRRQSVAGAGAGFGLFGGAGTIHDTGKAHDIVVPYIDENGIEQAPRFGVSSLTGNAIREWAKLIYDTLVEVQKNKTNQPEEQENEKTEEPKKSDEDPLKVLKLRLAKGEITKEEYEELKELLN